MDVGAWLKGHGLEEYAEAFAENGVDAALLPELSNEDLKDLGIARLVDRKRLLKAIALLADGDHQERAEPSATAAPAGERRQVTIFFADLSAYTELSEKLDAEELHDLVGRFFDATDRIIEDHGGTVHRHAGDEVMALFGVPVSHSDDPLRAVRSAIETHAAMAELGVELSHKLVVHIGIASGEVVVAAQGTETPEDVPEYAVTGVAANLASRLGGLAGAGETIISDDVYRAVEREVACDPLNEVAVKGLAKPVAVWRTGALRRDDAVVQRGPFVGRRAELAQFPALLETIKTSGMGQAILVRGEPGIGKSRLVEEFESIAAQAGFVCHKTLVLDFGVGKGQDAIRRLVRSLLDLPFSSGEEARAEAAAKAIQTGVLGRDREVFLNDLLDLDQGIELRALYDAMDNATRNQGKQDTVAELVRIISERNPLLLAVEDIHWANTRILDDLAALTRAASGSPLIVIMTTRIHGDPIDGAWRGSIGQSPLQTIDIPLFREQEAFELVMAHRQAVDVFAKSCVERAQGNPFFLEQLLRSASESVASSLPGAVQSVVQARLDNLAPTDKEALQAASVLGQRFALEALRNLIANAGYTLDRILALQLVRPEGEGYLFVHALVQEGVYALLLTDRRRNLHRKAAAWYGEQDPMLRAEHLDRADDLAAAAAYLDAAEAQTAALHFETALSLTDRGIELAEDPATKCDLMCLRGDALRNMGATEKSIAAFEAALDSAADDVRRCRAWIGMAGGLRVADRQKPALDALGKAEAAATKHGLLSERAQIHYLRGNVYFPLGNIDGCLEQHEKALGFAREVGSTEGEALALGGLGDAHYLRGHMRTASEQFRACVEVCHEHGFGRIEAANRPMVGWSRIHLMEFAEALDDALESAKTAAEISHHRAALMGLMLAGLMELELGQFVESQEHLERGRELAQTMSASNFEAQTFAFLARLSAAQGRMPEARDFAKRAIGVVRKVGMTFIGPTVLAIGAALTEDSGKRGEALEEAQEILDSGCVAHNHFWFAQTAIDHALEIGEWDEAEHYATRLEAYTREQPLAWSDYIIAQGRALAAWGRGTRTEALVAEIKRLHDLAVKCGMKLAAPNLKRALAAVR